MRVAINTNKTISKFNMGDCIVVEHIHSKETQYYLVSESCESCGWSNKGLFDLLDNTFYLLEDKIIEELLYSFEEIIVEVIPASKLVLKSE